MYCYFLDIFIERIKLGIEISEHNINCRMELLNTANVFHITLSFYATQIIKPFLKSRISANHIKVEGLSAN